MRRKKISHPGPPNPAGVLDEQASLTLRPEQFYALAAERLSALCAGCRTRKARKIPNQVVAVIHREIPKLGELLEEGKLTEALTHAERAPDWRFRRPELAAALLAKAREALPGDPRGSLDWARLGERVALLGSTPRHRERRAQALAYIGNAHRALSDLGKAAEFFAAARAEVGEAGIATPEVGADIDILESSLARDQRRPAAAEDLLRRALSVQLSEGLKVPAARTMISLSIPCLRQGKTKVARGYLTTALPSLAAVENRHLRLLALGNLCLCDTRDEDYSSASRRFTELCSEAKNGPINRFMSSRITWLRARILTGLGNEAQALGLYQAAFEELMSQDAPYDALLVALDWMRVAARRHHEVDIQYLASHLPEISQRTPELRETLQETIKTLVAYLLEGAFTEAMYWACERCLWREGAR